MNKNEELYFDGLSDDGQHVMEAMRMLREAYLGDTEKEDAWMYAEKWHHTFRDTFGERQAQAEAALNGEQRAEAKLLAETLDAIFEDIGSLCQILLALPGNPPEGMDTEMELAYQSLEELTKIFSYSSSLQTDYVKAEARTRKLGNYKIRSHIALMQSFRDLLAKDRGAETVFWKDVLEKLEHMTALSEEAAGMYQRLTESYI